MQTRTFLIAAALVGSCVLAARADSLTAVRALLSCAMQALTHGSWSLPYPAPPQKWQTLNAPARLANVRERLLPKLHEELAARHSKLGQAAFIRIFKESSELELWLKSDSGRWQLFRIYPIGCFSGTLGPKTREGDMQAPEGFYNVTSKQLNPASRYHLAFNVGYPNAYDLAHKRTGDLIMVHGDMCSIGCFAMTDPLIEEIYLVVEAALKNGGSMPVHIFPFRMSAERMKVADASQLDFWENLQGGHDVFQKEHRVPKISVESGRYAAH
jgi:murein L,D-transpeptidase YafK